MLSMWHSSSALLLLLRLLLDVAVCTAAAMGD